LPESRGLFHAILTELATSASKHFDEEETFLKRNNSPSLDVHVAEHTKYREIITNLLVEGSTGRLDRAKLHQVANDYLIKHMLTMDLADKSYLHAHQSI
jgi:hemerythrin